MNRHERRRKEKTQKVSSLQNLLIKGINYHSSKNFKKAEEIYKQIIDRDPSNYQAIRHLGILNQDLKNYQIAHEYYLKAAKLNPTGFEVLNNIGTIHVINKNYDLGLKCFRKSIEIAPNYIPSINNLASLYHKRNIPQEALNYSLKALELQPSNAMTQNQYAKSLVINNRLKEAINIFEDLNLKFPDNDDFKINLASAYREIGEFDKSGKIIKQGFLSNYKNIQYFIAYVNDKNNQLNQEHLTYYNECINKKEINNDDKVLICHSLFNYFKNIGEYDRAGEYLNKGNRIQYEMRKFDLKNEENYFEQIISLFDKKRTFKPQRKLISKIPIFICGMPRSGTTLCEQILSSHSQVHGGGELNYLAESCNIKKIISPSESELENFKNTLNNTEKLHETREKYLENIAKLTDENVNFITDKMPHNFILIGLVKLILPECKIIYCKRDPMDNCFSLFSHKFIELSHQYSYDQQTLALYYKMHDKLMNFWKNKFKNKFFTLDNEELVNDQEGITKKLLDFCELDWEENCLSFYNTKRQVRTASIEQVRSPINKKSIGAWKNYKSYLSDLKNSLN